jgi:uncharacterized protein DUF3305
MKHPLFPVAILMRRVPLQNRWISEKWELAEVRPDTSQTQLARLPIEHDGWLWRGLELDLHPSEGEGYYLNMTSPDPRVFVMWRLEEWEGSETARPWVATASYNEAARMMDAGETVDSLAMPPAVREWLTPWLEANYRPEPRRKHRRNERFWHEETPESPQSSPAKEDQR